MMRFDADRSGSIENRELANAIREFGWNLSPPAVEVMVRRYSRRSNGQIAFDDFIACCIRLRILSEGFRRRDAQGQGYAMLQYDDFIQLAMTS
jgi:hypothetical protein